MSFYRTVIAAVAAMGLASVAFAEDNTNNTTTQAPTEQAMQTADASTSTTTTMTNTTTTMQDKVDLNKSTAKDLAKVKGLNMTKAKAIVSFRKKHGDFKSTDDLKDVKGFKNMDEKTLKDIQDQLTIG
ncbi:MAG: helix-hairpin-helix domain-containing protein [Gammaproteobacteria bacterium]